MSHHTPIMLSGIVTDVFAHRFVVQTETGRALADLGPRGAQQVTLRDGDHVVLAGEMKPSELKVMRIAKDGGPAIVIEHKGPQPDEHAPADPRPALTTAETSGFAVLGTPRRKPKHFEILGRDSRGRLAELHVELDGTLRKTRPVDAADTKWAADIRNSRDEALS